jgi:ribosomal protein L11 methyltransferase
MTNPASSSSVPKRTWRVVEFLLDPSHEDMASWLLMQLGANGCELEPDSSGSTRLRATFDEDKLPAGDTTRIAAAMEEYGLSTSIPSLRVSSLEESDWLAEWKKGFAPFPVGERLLVCPEWEKSTLPADVKADRSVIYIEPGMAFGTGFHPTTRFCLLMVERLISSSPRVLDVGTGSGILAIGAALLSSSAVIVAVETDPLACRVARENFESNGVASRVDLLEGSTDALLPTSPAPFDLILSNLTYEDNAALLPDYMHLSRAGTYFAFAGILREKLDRMRSTLATHSLEIIEEELGDMWAGVLARRQ